MESDTLGHDPATVYWPHRHRTPARFRGQSSVAETMELSGTHQSQSLHRSLCGGRWATTPSSRPSLATASIQKATAVPSGSRRAEIYKELSGRCLREVGAARKSNVLAPHC